MSLMNMNGHHGKTPFAGTERLKVVKGNFIFLANESIIFHPTERKCVEHYNCVLRRKLNQSMQEDVHVMGPINVI